MMMTYNHSTATLHLTIGNYENGHHYHQILLTHERYAMRCLLMGPCRSQATTDRLLSNQRFQLACRQHQPMTEGHATTLAGCVATGYQEAVMAVHCWALSIQNETERQCA